MATTSKTSTPKVSASARMAHSMRHPKGKTAKPASWATIGTKIGCSAATARRLYDTFTGEPGSHHASRIPGKGGRTVRTEAAAAA